MGKNALKVQYILDEYLIYIFFKKNLQFKKNRKDPIPFTIKTTVMVGIERFLSTNCFCRLSWDMILPEGTVEKEEQIDKLVAIIDFFFQIPENCYLALSWGIFCRKHCYSCNPLCIVCSVHKQSRGGIVRLISSFIRAAPDPSSYPSVLPDIYRMCLLATD